MEQHPYTKQKPQDLPLEGSTNALQTNTSLLEDMQETIIAPSLRGDPTIASAPQCEHEREGTHSPNNHPNQVTNVILHHNGNTSAHK